MNKDLVEAQPHGNAEMFELRFHWKSGEVAPPWAMVFPSISSIQANLAQIVYLMTRVNDQAHSVQAANILKNPGLKARPSGLAHRFRLSQTRTLCLPKSYPSLWLSSRLLNTVQYRNINL